MAKTGCKVEFTVDEIISLLHKTSLPTVIVEGADDIVVYRRFEQQLAHIGLSVLPVGGREKVLEVFDRRAEIGKNVQLAFVADMDTWINTGLPAAYADERIVFTAGYSIENDVFIDGNLVDLVVGEELVAFKSELVKFTQWYALALCRHLADSTKPIALHPDQVLDPAQYGALVSLSDGESFPQESYDQILEQYQYRLRGKSLLALLLRSTNRRVQQPRHSTAALMEMVAARPGENLQRIANAVVRAFA